MKRPGFLGEEKKPNHSHKKQKDSMKHRNYTETQGSIQATQKSLWYLEIY